MAHFGDYMEGEAALGRDFIGVNSARHRLALQKCEVISKLRKKTDATKRVPPAPKQALFLRFWSSTLRRGRLFIDFCN